MMQLKTEDLRVLLNNGTVLWTTHCLQRMGERDIQRDDVKNCIQNGEIIGGDKYVYVLQKQNLH